MKLCVWLVGCYCSCRQHRAKLDDSQLSRARRKSMENMELVKLTPDKVCRYILLSVLADKCWLATCKLSWPL